jgi:RNA polymerase sigma factor (sigma-70 family)
LWRGTPVPAFSNFQVVTFPRLLDIVVVSPETMLGQSREASFTELYSRYARDVYRFVLYLSGESTLAEDITSETFLRVWLTDTPIRLETVKSWLLTIARNLFRHELRHLRRTQELPTDLRGVARQNETPPGFFAENLAFYEWKGAPRVRSSITRSSWKGVEELDSTGQKWISPPLGDAAV